MQKFVGPGFFFTHWLYARWKHGKKATLPMMHLAGFPVANKIDRKCNPEYCQEGSFKEIFEQIKERF
jgi:hypothetical protein